MVPEEAGDLWMAYNLIAEGDIILAVQSESDSPPMTAAGDDAVSGGGEVVPRVMNISIKKIVGVINSPTITVGSTIGSGIGGGGGGSGELMMGKKKRGWPRKYDSSGNLRIPLVRSPPGRAILPSHSRHRSTLLCHLIQHPSIHLAPKRAR
ncbi:Hypothetical predicted protein [Olea europaea subsp. europaea]|uniref:Uncharacterized protein n=1 Tax=Olea europaea subsp. europaea TaxID=158383 RepID=A0A8S0RMY1_OLEEU|nr:Hypothetical predicted protein [Olea europaea subsp. europaea]